MGKDKKKVTLSQTQKRVLIIMTCITIGLILVGCFIGIQKTNRGREDFIASNYRKYKEDDTWKEIDEFKNYENFEDFWEHEKDDRAKHYTPLKHTNYSGEKDYYYTLYEQQSYRYWFKASLNHSQSFLLPCFNTIVASRHI